MLAGLFFALQALAAGASASVPPACASFAADLEVMVSADQAIRQHLGSVQPVGRPFTLQELPRLMRYGDIVDKRNTERLKAYLGQCGWPKRSSYSAKASHHAWLLVQHADHDRPFQREVLALLEPLVVAGEVSSQNFAYLSDRLSVADGQPQLYGTQFKAEGMCVIGFAALDDRERVEERRRVVGLPSLDRYLKSVQERSPPGCRPAAP